MLLLLVNFLRRGSCMTASLHSTDSYTLSSLAKAVVWNKKKPMNLLLPSFIFIMFFFIFFISCWKWVTKYFCCSRGFSTSLGTNCCFNTVQMFFCFFGFSVRVLFSFFSIHSVCWLVQIWMYVCRFAHAGRFCFSWLWGDFQQRSVSFLFLFCLWT